MLPSWMFQHEFETWRDISDSPPRRVNIYRVDLYDDREFTWILSGKWKPQSVFNQVTVISCSHFSNIWVLKPRSFELKPWNLSTGLQSSIAHLLLMLLENSKFFDYVFLFQFTRIEGPKDLSPVLENTQHSEFLRVDQNEKLKKKLSVMRRILVFFF